MMWKIISGIMILVGIAMFFMFLGGHFLTDVNRCEDACVHDSHVYSCGDDTCKANRQLMIDDCVISCIELVMRDGR